MTQGQPLADVSEFSLPGRMRELGARILWDLFRPLREKVAQIEKAAKDDEAQSELKLDEEVDKFAGEIAAANKKLSAQREFIASKAAVSNKGSN